MSSTVVVAAGKQGVLAPTSSRVRKQFRLIPRIEDDPQVVSFAKTILGKLVLLSVFGLALSMLVDSWQWKLCLVGATTFFPRARRLIVTVGTLLLTDFFWFERGTLKMIVAPSSPAFSRIAEFVWIILPFVLFCAA